MPPPARPEDDRAMLSLLRRVSRSFYLSVRLLPAALRRPVCIGYLLARTSDTIADAPVWTPAQRLQMLAEFEDALRGERAPCAFDPGRVEDNGERELLNAFPRVLAWLAATGEEDRADIGTVLRHITRGQRLDIERFGAASANDPHSLASDEELIEYAYLVAGCVGEFWTKLSFRHVAGFSSLPQEQMLSLGRNYGEALQLLNVLRDAGRDREHGRVYVPHVQETPRWVARAGDGLRSGLQYSLAIRPARLRVASALPALIGVRMIGPLRNAPGKPFKVPRADVKALLWRLALSLGSRSRIEREFRRWDNPPR